MAQPSSRPSSSEPGAPLARSLAEDLARTLRAVADPTRLQILSVVLDSSDGRATVGQLSDALELRQPTVTHHVRILVDDGLLQREPDGKFVWLSVSPDRLPAIQDLLR
ncbi:ArsR/SmtB family transcription factor [Microbacterium sp.]|uniref:ArsR/SmtB family transcription factor n=1 Tax=Microbacterium sp. TaxID=51671 RepID=UPI00351D1E95